MCMRRRNTIPMASINEASSRHTLDSEQRAIGARSFNDRHVQVNHLACVPFHPSSLLTAAEPLAVPAYSGAVTSIILSSISPSICILALHAHAHAPTYASSMILSYPPSSRYLSLPSLSFSLARFVLLSFVPLVRIILSLVFVPPLLTLALAHACAHYYHRLFESVYLSFSPSPSHASSSHPSFLPPPLDRTLHM
jgi:hypothetical protein